MSDSISDVLHGWGADDLANLAYLLDCKYEADGPITAEVIEDMFKWHYYTKLVEDTRNTTLSLLRRTLTSLPSDPSRKLPPYETLVHEACGHMKADEKDATFEEREAFLAQAVILAALQRMGARQRSQFFEQEIEIPGLANDARIKGRGFGGPATTLGLLGAAQASGFGVYMASTTALGFLTHAVGVTLPFAVYSGMTSTIAFVIGPAGWLAVGGWGAWKLVQPRWKKMIPGLIYISAVNARPRPEEDE
jgi:uncharacterized protein YaaW (UPF0174 family)